MLMVSQGCATTFNPPVAVAVSGGLLYQHCINNNGRQEKGWGEVLLEGLLSSRHQEGEEWKAGQQLREERQEVALLFACGGLLPSWSWSGLQCVSTAFAASNLGSRCPLFCWFSLFVDLTRTSQWLLAAFREHPRCRLLC